MPSLSQRADVPVWCFAAVSVRVLFWAWTGRIWEDALITVAHARNAVEGLGLTHHAGEPLTHGFTSALAVMIPVLGEAMVAGSGVDFVRIYSLLAVVVTIVAADAIGRQLDLSRWARFAVMGYLALDTNHIFYGMSGMETQVAVAALLVSVWSILVRHRLAGVALGVALLARPDFILWAGCLGLVLLHRDRFHLARVVTGSALVVAPWLAFTTLYYGSPIPNTIVAKAAGYTTFPTGGGLDAWAGWLIDQPLQHTPIIVRSFTPFLEDSLAFGAPFPTVFLLVIGAALLVLSAWGFWTNRADPRWLPLAGFTLAYTTYRILFLPTAYFDWYAPPLTAIGIFAIAAIFQRLTRRPMRERGAAFLLLVAVAIPLPWVFGMEREIQRTIEDGVRRQVSVALKAHVAPGEGVVSESAGYIGFVSRVTLFDYPGLTSPTSIAALRALPREERTLVGLVDSLRPPWLVLRIAELAEFRRTLPSVAREYTEVERFGTERRELEWFGYRKLTVDDGFVILQRNA